MMYNMFKYYDYGLIDNLNITRDGNQLKKVTDQCDELTYAGAMDFKDGVNEHVEYTWDNPQHRIYISAGVVPDIRRGFPGEAAKHK